MSAQRVPGDQVSFYSGHSFAQRPLSFTWNERQYQVEEVLVEWKTPDEKIFLVRTTEGEEFELVLELDDYGN